MSRVPRRHSVSQVQNDYSRPAREVVLPICERNGSVIVQGTIEELLTRYYLQALIYAFESSSQ